ncbi:MAG: metal-dependent transcriptional regulator [bacterium]|nr:metal-dependent transcriptional regulator [bacterium]
MVKKLSSNMEMYLKTILRLGNRGGAVRVKDIAAKMEVTMPSVSEALRTLKTKGLVLHPSYGEVKLSARGRRVAEGVNDRFEILQRFLVEVLQVDERTAAHEACEIEHVVGDDTFERLSACLDFVGTCRMDLSKFIEHLHMYLEWRMNGEHCPDCELKEETEQAAH